MTNSLVLLNDNIALQQKRQRATPNFILQIGHLAEFAPEQVAVIWDQTSLQWCIL